MIRLLHVHSLGLGCRFPQLSQQPTKGHRPGISQPSAPGPFEACNKNSFSYLHIAGSRRILGETVGILNTAAGNERPAGKGTGRRLPLFCLARWIESYMARGGWAGRTIVCNARQHATYLFGLRNVFEELANKKNVTRRTPSYLPAANGLDGILGLAIHVMAAGCTGRRSGRRGPHPCRSSTTNLRFKDQRVFSLASEVLL